MIYLFVFYVCFLPFLMPYLPRIPALDVNFLNIFFYVLVLCFILSCGLKKDFKMFNRWIVALLVYSIIVIASVAWSPVYVYNERVLKDLFSSIFIPLVIALLASNLLRDSHYRQILVKSFYPAAIFLALSTLFQLITGRADYEGYRAAGALSNANGTAIFLVLFVPYMLWGIEKRLIPQWMGIGSMLITAAGVLGTISRKGMATFVLALLLYLFFSRRIKMLFASCALILITGIFILAIPQVGARFERIELQSEFKGRSGMVAAGWDMFMNQPIKGLGYDGFRENIMKYQPIFTTQKLDAHNNYITALANYGLLGFIPLMFVLLLPLLTTFKHTLHNNTLSVAYISSALPFLVSAYFAGGLFYSFIIMPLFYTLSAMAMVGSET